MNINLTWLLSKYIHRKDWLSFLKLNTTFYDFGSLSSSIDPTIYTNYAIRCAAQNGYVKIVEILLQDPRVEPFTLMSIYVIVKDSQVIELVLQDPRVDPSANYNYAIIHANENKVTSLLLQDPRVDPSDINNDAIIFAGTNGHVKVVELLLQDHRVDPSAQYNSAIRYAAQNGHVKVVKLLHQDPRVEHMLLERFMMFFQYLLIKMIK